MDNAHECGSTPSNCDRNESKKDSENGSSSVATGINTALIKKPYAPISVKSSLVDWLPSRRRAAIAAGKTGVSIATGMLSISPALNVAVSAAFVLFESIQAIQDYRQGVLNRLGYRTSSLDVGLRIGKEAAQVGVSLLVGSLVGLGIGLTSFPLVGQLIAAGAISVGLGICVGALLTRYADRAVIRIQIRAQYKYPRDERGAQERFEQILEGMDDLTSIETCRIVQHYIDYRIASGWEEISDKETYQEAGYPIELLPKSLQHFTAVRLQRKWGFLRNRGACKKVFHALMLQHHPDRGGNPLLAAQLSVDFEIYAFCRQWWGDCRSILTTPDQKDGQSKKNNEAIHAKQSLWKIIRNFFFVPRGNSEEFAQDLHSYNQLLLCEASVASRQGASSRISSSTEGSSVPSTSTHDWDHSMKGSPLPGNSSNPEEEVELLNVDEEEGSDAAVPKYFGLSIAEQTAAVSRVLDCVLQRYSNAVEMINYVSLLRISKEEAVWKSALRHAETFSRMQSILHCCEIKSSSTDSRVFITMNWGVQCIPPTGNKKTSPLLKKRRNLSLSAKALSLSDVIQQREASKNVLASTVFTDEIKNTLTHALELWRTANNLVSNFLWTQATISGEANGGKEDGETQANLHARNSHSGNSVGHVMDTLLRIQSKLDKIVEEELGESTDYEKRHEDDFLQELKIIGLSASSALGGEHAVAVRDSVLDLCESYIRVWPRKQITYQNLQAELRFVQAQKAALSSQCCFICPKEPEESSIPTSPAQPFPSAVGKLNSLTETEKSYMSDLLLLNQQLWEVDTQFQEIDTICLCFLPEHREKLNSFPSTVLWGILLGREDKGEAAHFKVPAVGNYTLKEPFHNVFLPRFRPFERELRLSFFEEIQEEPGNCLEPYPQSTLEVAPENRTASGRMTETDGQDLPSTSCVHFEGGLEFRLWRATKVDPKTGTRSLCWLKQYDFRSIDAPCLEDDQKGINGNENDEKGESHQRKKKDAFRRRKVFVRLVAKLMKEELSYASKCQSSRVVCSKEVFSETETCSIYFIAPRETTQQRFRSVKNVLTHIRPLELTWLHEALQCIIDLHASSCPHGSIRLSNFTYDSFGHVSVGLFSPSPCTVDPAFYLESTNPQHWEEATTRAFEQDATDFGIMILSEILPFYGIKSEVSSRSSSDGGEVDELHVFRVFKEIGERLVAKIQPKFTLQHARAFVKRCMQIPIYTTLTPQTKQKNYFPIEWGRKTYTNNMHLEPVHDWPLFLGVNNTSRSFRRMKIYRNVNPFLWERYFRNREVVSNTNPPPPPPRVSQCPLFLFCGDDAEVNERFLWCVCDSESDAWHLCYRGVPKKENLPKMKEDAGVRVPFLCLSNPFKWFEDPANRTLWGPHLLLVVFRVVLGAIIEKQTHEQETFVLSEENRTLLFHDDLENSPIRQLSVIPSSPHAAYPELVLRLGS